MRKSEKRIKSRTNVANVWVVPYSASFWPLVTSSFLAKARKKAISEGRDTRKNTHAPHDGRFKGCMYASPPEYDRAPTRPAGSGSYIIYSAEPAASYLSSFSKHPSDKTYMVCSAMPNRLFLAARPLLGGGGEGAAVFLTISTTLGVLVHYGYIIGVAILDKLGIGNHTWVRAD